MDFNKIIARVRSILLSPRSEWPVVATEPASVGGLYSGYVIVIAAIPAIVQLIRTSLIGVSVPLLGSYRVGMGAALGTAIITYVLSLIGIYVIAVIVDALAPTFSAEKNRVQALKVVAYSYTAVWVASILGLIPGLAILAAIAGVIYAIYLLNMGLPFTMKCPADKSVGYTALTILTGIVVGFVLNLIIAAGTRTLGFGYGYGRGISAFAPPSAVGVPGDRGGFASGTPGAALQAWANRVNSASQQLNAAQRSGDSTAQANAVGQLLGAALGSGGKVESLAPERIKPFLPATLAGLPRTQISVERNAALGMQVSTGRATYGDGTRSLQLEVTDTGSLKGLVGFAGGWAGTEQDRETDTGYDKVYKSGSELVHEQWDNRSHSGEYGLIVADRFAVKVSGPANDIGDLKSAVGSLDLTGLAALRSEGVASK